MGQGQVLYDMNTRKGVSGVMRYGVLGWNLCWERESLLCLYDLME